MASGPAPRAAVRGPEPTAPRVSLITSAPPVDDLDLRWANGVAYRSEICGAGIGRVGLCPGGETKDSASGQVLVEADPFAVYASYNCPPQTGLSLEDYKARARANLEAFFAKEVEEELWTGGAVTTNPRLAAPEADELSASAEDSVDALACLEHYLAVCGSGGRGMIHATRRVVTLWAKDGLVRREGGLVLTVTDNIVVPGAGYPGTDPDSDAGDITPTSGEDWAYATGMVQVRREADSSIVPATMAEAVNRQTNDAEFRAERAAVVTFDPCCHAGIPITVPACAVGGS